MDAGCNSRRSLSKDLVDVLLDISEEILEKQEGSEIPNQSGWDEAIQGWGQCSPFSYLFPAQQKKKLKPESSASHCVLCTNLRDPNLSEHVVPSNGASEASQKTPKEHSRSNISSSLEHLNRAITATSCLEEKAFTLSLSNRSLDNNLLFGLEQYTTTRDAPCLYLEDRNAGKAVLPGRVMGLSTVKMAPNSNTNLKNSNVLKSREVSGDMRPVIVSEKAGERHQEKQVAISNSRTTSQGSAVSKQAPTQYQCHLMSELNNSGRHQNPINTLTETQPSAFILQERNSRQEEPMTSSVQHRSGHTWRVGSREKSQKRAEPQLPMLLGTRIQIPVSAQRLH